VRWNRFSHNPSRWPLSARAALCAVALLAALFAGLEWIAHRPSPIRATVTPSEIAAANATVKRAGLILRDGDLLKIHPFTPPWTAQSLLVPPAWFREPVIKLLLGPRRVRADLLLADLDVLQPVMERAYGGWDSAAARGWNWSQWFRNWRCMLAAKGSAEVSLNEAFAPVDALMLFQRDNHTQIPLNRWSTSDGSQTAVLAGMPNGPCTEIRAGGRSYSISPTDAAQHIRKAKLWRLGADEFLNANYITMPSSFGPPQAALCRGARIRLEPVGSRGGGLSFALSTLWSALRPKRPAIRRLGEGAVYVRLPTFNWRNYHNFSETGWPSRQPGDRVLIVDLRNNEGGSEDYGLAILRGWIDEQAMVPLQDLGTQLNSSCLFAPLKWNYMILSSPAVLSDAKGYMQGLLDRMAQFYPPGCPRTVETNPAKWSYPQRRFNPKPGEMRIVALVDSLCASDCELLTERLASLPEAIVAGANTFGVGQFIQPGYSVLPHTGLPFRIALGMSNFYGDSRSYDGYGLDVDIVVPKVDSLQDNQLRELAQIVEKLPSDYARGYKSEN
jgi:hypothetical protein